MDYGFFTIMREAGSPIAKNYGEFVMTWRGSFPIAAGGEIVYNAVATAIAGELWDKVWRRVPWFAKRSGATTHRSWLRQTSPQATAPSTVRAGGAITATFVNATPAAVIAGDHYLFGPYPADKLGTHPSFCLALVNRLARVAGVTPTWPAGGWPAGSWLFGEGKMPSPTRGRPARDTFSCTF